MAKVNAIKNGFFQKCSHFTHADGLNMQKYNKFNAVEWRPYLSFLFAFLREINCFERWQVEPQQFLLIPSFFIE